MPRGQRRTRSGNVLLNSAELIGWALGGLEREIAKTRERLAALNAQAARLRARAGARGRRSLNVEETPGSAAPRRGRRRGGMTAQGRKRISEMMKRRWAEAKKKNKNRL
jgi:hypothetical protein